MTAVRSLIPLRNLIKYKDVLPVLSNSGSHIPPAIHRSSNPPPSRHFAEHRSSFAHNVRYIAIATWEDWIVGGLKV